MLPTPERLWPLTRHSSASNLHPEYVCIHKYIYIYRYPPNCNPKLLVVNCAFRWIWRLFLNPYSILQHSLLWSADTGTYHAALPGSLPVWGLLPIGTASGHGSRHLKWVRHWNAKCVYISLVSASATVASFCRSLSSVWASSELMSTSGSIFLSRDTHCTLSLNFLASDMISLTKTSWGPLYMCIVSKLSQLPVLFEGVGLLLGPTCLKWFRYRVSIHHSWKNASALVFSIGVTTALYMGNWGYNPYDWTEKPYNPTCNWLNFGNPWNPRRDRGCLDSLIHLIIPSKISPRIRAMNAPFVLGKFSAIHLRIESYCSCIPPSNYG